VRAATLDLPDKMKARSAVAKAVEDLRQLRTMLQKAQGMTFQACVEEACSKFYDLHRDRVLQVLALLLLLPLLRSWSADGTAAAASSATMLLLGKRCCSEQHSYKLGWLYSCCKCSVLC
jgi:Ubiquitin-activating enzyme active site